MTKHTFHHCEPRATRLAVTFMIGGRPRTFAPKPWLCAVIAIGVPILAAWYLAATFYFVFHDQLLASLISRQTETQYVYEDRIAGLSTQLDRETSRSLVDRHTLETTVRDLEERSTRLATHAAMIDQLIARNAAEPVSNGLTVPVTRTRAVTVGSTRNPLLVPAPSASLPGDVRAYSDAEPSQPLTATAPDVPALRLRSDERDDGAAARAPSVTSPDKRADAGQALSIAAASESVAATLARVEKDQDAAIATLREPAFRTVAKLRTALMELGLSARIIPAAARGEDVGGPFVPLPAGALSFEQNVALLHDAMLQADRLTALVDKVPLRKPVPGALEVTSPFGARLDPFYGRPAMHTGVDFREPNGANVHATAGGTVTIASVDGGYGMMVEVDHGNGLSTRYAHLSSATVLAGQKIEAGAFVGRVGSTGRATGPHLHYETRINGEAVDPTRFLKVGAKLFDD